MNKEDCGVSVRGLKIERKLETIRFGMNRPLVWSLDCEEAIGDRTVLTDCFWKDLYGVECIKLLKMVNTHISNCLSLTMQN